jgi:acetyltransferase
VTALALAEPASPPPADDRVALADGRVAVLRGVTPDDAAAHRDFMARLAPEDVRTRFHRPVRWLPPDTVRRFTTIDPSREIAFIATAMGRHGRPETLGVARAAFEPGRGHAEMAVTVRSDLKRRGLGRALLARLVEECRARGITELRGSVMRENLAMLRLAERLGAQKSSSSAGPGAIEIKIRLDDGAIDRA